MQPVLALAASPTLKQVEQVHLAFQLSVILCFIAGRAETNRGIGNRLAKIVYYGDWCLSDVRACERLVLTMFAAACASDAVHGVRLPHLSALARYGQ